MTRYPTLTLVVRDGHRLRPCAVKESTHRPGQAPQWQVCGHTPTTLDPDGVALCAAHFRRLAQCGSCGAVGVEGAGLTWHPDADAMCCPHCWLNAEASYDHP